MVLFVAYDLITKKYRNFEFKVLDCAVEMYSRNMIYESFNNIDYIISIIEPYNVEQAVSLIEICKIISTEAQSICFGTAASLIPNYLSSINCIDYIIADGNFAQGIVEVMKLNNKSTKIVTTTEIDSGLEWGTAINSFVPIEKYKLYGNNMFEMTVQKGCPYNCTFCSEKILFKDNCIKQTKHRPVKDIINNLDVVINQFTSIYFSATTFTYNKDWVKELCVSMIKTNNVIPWRSVTRVDSIPLDLIPIMKNSGLKQLSLGIETINDKLLKSVNKRQDSKDIIDNISVLKKMGVDIKALLILGLPGQTFEEVENTQRIIESLKMPYRWKEYSPIRELYLKDIENKVTTSDLKEFSREKFNVTSVRGLSSERYMELLFPNGYVR